MIDLAHFLYVFLSRQGAKGQVHTNVGHAMDGGFEPVHKFIF